MLTIKLPPLPELPRLMHGDCLELMREIPTGSVDMILCDLPYGTTQNKWDTVIPFAPLWEQYKRVTKPNAAIVLTAAQPFTSALVMSNTAMFVQALVWHKNAASNFLNANKNHMQRHEDVLIFAAARTTFNKQLLAGAPYISRRGGGDTGQNYNAIKQRTATKNEGVRNPTSILQFDRQTGLHPTQKPVALMEYLIRTYTNEGQTVLDNCMGSGTTGVACRNTNRKFIGIEQLAKYFAIAHERILNADT